MTIRRGLLALACSFAPLACSSGATHTGEPGAGPPVPLVSYEATETMHQGMGSSGETVAVAEDGHVLRESRSGDERRTCEGEPLAGAGLQALGDLVQRARAAGLQAAYDTSTLPGPDANYSRDQTIVLGGGTPLTVRIEGWADEPPEIVELTNWLNAHVGACATP